MKAGTSRTESRISIADFAALGIEDIAYVKRITHEDEIMWAIHSANGTPIALVTERDLAFAIVRQNDLDPVSVH